MRATNETRKPIAAPNGKTAGKTATKNDTRIDRWRRLAEERIAWLAESPELPGLAMLRTCAEIEGMTPADLIVDRLTRARAGGKIIEERPEDCCSAEFNAFIDTDYERNMSTRARNNHEREVVTFMILDFAEGTWIPRDLVKRYGVRFVRNYYHKGDTGLFAAFHRMATAALRRIDYASRASISSGDTPSASATADTRQRRVPQTTTGFKSAKSSCRG